MSNIVKIFKKRLTKLSEIVKIVKIVWNCQKLSKLSKIVKKIAKIVKQNSKIVKIIKNCKKKSQKLPKLSKCWLGHVSSSLWSNVSKVTGLLGGSLMSKNKSGSVTHSVTQWQGHLLSCQVTAKNDIIKIRF